MRRLSAVMVPLVLDSNLLLSTLHVPAEVPVQCELSWKLIPVVEIRQVRKLVANANARGRARGRGRRGRQAALGMNFLRKNGIAEKAIVYRRWPMYLPGTMARALLRGEQQHVLTLCQNNLRAAPVSQVAVRVLWKFETMPRQLGTMTKTGQHSGTTPDRSFGGRCLGMQ